MVVVNSLCIHKLCKNKCCLFEFGRLINLHISLNIWISLGENERFMSCSIQEYRLHFHFSEYILFALFCSNLYRCIIFIRLITFIQFIFNSVFPAKSITSLKREVLEFLDPTT